jgi:hypothetical protein
MNKIARLFLTPLVLFAPALILVGFLASPVRADVLDGWCAQAKLPSSIAICSDPDPRNLAIERQHAFDAAREGWRGKVSSADG